MMKPCDCGRLVYGIFGGCVVGYAMYAATIAYGSVAGLVTCVVFYAILKAGE